MKFLAIVILCISTSVFAEKSRVTTALEAFPPLVTSHGEGMVVNLLKEIESISNYTFDISITTYARAKRELQGDRAQLIGLTPKGNETDEFYQFADELAWELPVSVDIFVNDLSKAANYKEIYIGVPTGNADFFSELLDIPRKNFVEVTHLNQLTQMLNLNRIDGIIFERIAVVETFKTTGYKQVYYQQLTTTAASMAVSNSPVGKILKNDLDYYINKVQKDAIFANYNNYLNLPTSGDISALVELTRQ
ncbi:hypothetical protein HII17_11515 [Thalassotalea sp. M1531]|uniref:Solute-binding protein family 3/N-terminal domain-containing protein n=1 Tax=Thalassotalea algicola TaxID=2716224 RepID=A0A7Y0LCT2_9GAMM|nr:hypothetical protein [Thalassotalea algicola]NMP32199.1 hypothetical protein [Thalassotalea algicola]